MVEIRIGKRIIRVHDDKIEMTQAEQPVKELRVETSGEQNVVIIGQVENLVLKGPGSIQVHGAVKQIDSAQGSINVEGSVMGNISCPHGHVDVTGSVIGTVDTNGGSVNVQASVIGNVRTTSGDVKVGVAVLGEVSQGSLELKAKA